MGAYDTEAGIHTGRIVAAIGELTEEVRGLRADIGELRDLLGNHHSETMGQVSEASREICNQIMIWSPD